MNGGRDWVPVAFVPYVLAVLVLLSPVTTDETFDGQERSGDGTGSVVCGLVITHAFVRPAESDPKQAYKADCAAGASDRVGYGLGLLLLAAPFTVLALLRPRGDED